MTIRFTLAHATKALFKWIGAAIAVVVLTACTAGGTTQPASPQAVQAPPATATTAPTVAPVPTATTAATLTPAPTPTAATPPELTALMNSGFVVRAKDGEPGVFEIVQDSKTIAEAAVQPETGKLTPRIVVDGKPVWLDPAKLTLADGNLVAGAPDGTLYLLASGNWTFMPGGFAIQADGTLRHWNADTKAFEDSPLPDAMSTVTSILASDGGFVALDDSGQVAYLDKTGQWQVLPGGYRVNADGKPVRWDGKGWVDAGLPAEVTGVAGFRDGEWLDGNQKISAFNAQNLTLAESKGDTWQVVKWEDGTILGYDGPVKFRWLDDGKQDITPEALASALKNRKYPYSLVFNSKDWTTGTGEKLGTEDFLAVESVFVKSIQPREVWFPADGTIKTDLVLTGDTGKKTITWTIRGAVPMSCGSDKPQWQSVLEALTSGLNAGRELDMNFTMAFTPAPGKELKDFLALWTTRFGPDMSIATPQDYIDWSAGWTGTQTKSAVEQLFGKSVIEIGPDLLLDSIECE